jgi:hypothetical protein
MIYTNHYDWSKGDLVKITKSHSLLKGDPDGIWPDIFVKRTKENTVQIEISAESVVIALDDMPLLGASAIVRIIYDDNVWVANSNYIQPIYLSNEREK